MKFASFLLVIMLTSCYFFSGETQAKKDIEQFFLNNNSNPGAGKTEVYSIDIISIEGRFITAYVKGYYKNSSLPVPESGDLKDTLIFKYYNEDSPRKLKIISNKN